MNKYHEHEPSRTLRFNSPNQQYSVAREQKEKKHVASIAPSWSPQDNELRAERV